MSAPTHEGIAAKVLVVDDEAGVRRVLTRLLSAEGYEVLEAASGQEGLELLWTHGADTVLLDVMMPRMDGLEVCRRIRKNSRTAHTPVVFITAAVDRQFRRQARKAGADDFLAKPFDEVELLARVNNTVRMKLYHDGLTRERNRLRNEVDGRTRALDEATDRLERLTEDLRIAREETILRLARAAEFRDDETAAHLQRMSHYCYLIGKKKNLDEYTCEMLRIASPMHDVGKIGIPDHILLKPGRLTPDEYTIMKQHAEIGYKILSGSQSPLVELAANIAHTHHEKWDGSGYPRGLRGEAIPMEGRIAAVADVFDALTSERPYKKAWPLDDAVALLQRGRGAHFDPELVDLFLGSMDEVLDIKQEFKDHHGGGETRLPS
ncbi:response regulator [Paraliomyxa miuraensis]|uniref:response regulator n=1 Tax=Paraliomyxa miuraensis TaxID=376150 RepID=UPI00225A6FCE|nr:two-component system response regulator [Paraliomyxa miuraensis]MCX4247294.1 two-component system response regulator [Paraliomyxa miuraensis]